MIHHLDKNHLTVRIPRISLILLIVTVPLFEVSAQNDPTRTATTQLSNKILASVGTSPDWNSIDKNISATISENIPPTISILISPAKDATITTNQDVVFKWHKSYDSDPITYELQIVGPWAFSLVVDNLNDTTYSLHANTISKDSIYLWNVIVKDGQTSTNSVIFNFWANLPPGNFSVLSHKNGDYADILKDIEYKWGKSKDDDPIT